MKKPAHQWETRLGLAFRQAGAVPGFEHDGRAEAFELRFHDGHVGHVRCGLSRQEADAEAARDPDLVHAVEAWLAARGQRTIHLFGGQRLLAEGPFSVRELGDDVRAPGALITLCPSNAELVHALGCFDRVIACEDSSDYPPEVAERERLGPDLGPDLDRVAALAPDLAVSSLTVPGMERVVTGLRARGVPQAVLAPRSIADVLHEALGLAAQLGVPERGATLVADMQRQIAELEAQRPAEPARVYLEWWPKPMFTPGADCYSNELIRLAGGENVFAARPGSSVEVSAAELVAAAPDVCFVSWCGVALDKLDPENLRSRPGLGELDAARRGHVFPLDEAYSGRPGPRMLEAARIMAAAISAVKTAPGWASSRVTRQ